MLLDSASPAVLAAIAALVIVPLVLVLLSFVTAAPRKDGDAPPVWGGGLPLVGHFMKFASSPVDTIREGYMKCGSVFTMRFLKYDMTFLIGPEAQACFYRANDEELSQNEPYKFMTPIFGRGIVFDAPIHIKNQQLRFVSSALKASALRTYVPHIVRETEEFLAGWGDEGTVDLLEAMARLTILTASRCLLGKEVRETLFESVSELLKDLDEGISPIAIFFPNAPLPAFRKRDRARAEIDRLFAGVIKSRRERGDVAHDDMLQAFMDAQYKDGSRCTDYQITGLLLGTLFAGQHTSSITSTWTLLNVASHPDIAARVMAESAAVLGPDGRDTSRLSFDTVSQLDTLHRCVKESLRQYPPLIMLMRQVHVPLTVPLTGGGTAVVPKGNLVFVSPAVAMNLPEGAPDAVFPHPERFDPDRFGPERAEDKIKPFAYSAFGGGMHGCLGEQFGFLQVKAIVSIILRNFELEVVGEMPKPNYRVMVVGPVPGTLVRYRRRKAPLA